MAWLLLCFKRGAVRRVVRSMSDLMGASVSSHPNGCELDSARCAVGAGADWAVSIVGEGPG